MKLTITTFAQLIIYIQGVISVPILVKALDIVGYGQYLLDLALIGLVVGVANIGVLIKNRNEFPGGEYNEKINIYIRQITLNSALGLVVLILMALLLNLASVKTSIIESKYNFFLFAFYLVSNVMFSFTADFFRYSGETNKFSLITVAQMYGSIFLILLVTRILSEKIIEVATVILLQGVTYLFISIVGAAFILIRAENHENIKNCLKNINLWSNVKVSAPLILSFVMDSLVTIFERIIITVKLGAVVLGQYSPIFMIATFSIISIKILNIVSYHVISKLYLQKSNEKLMIEFDKIIFIGMASAIAYAMFIVINGWFIIGIFLNGKIQKIEWGIFGLISVGAVLANLAQICHMTLIASGHTKSMPKINFSVNILYISILLILIYLNQSLISVVISYVVWQLALAIISVIEINKYKLAKIKPATIKKLIRFAIVNASIMLILMQVLGEDSNGLGILLFSFAISLITLFLAAKKELFSLRDS